MSTSGSSQVKYSDTAVRSWVAGIAGGKSPKDVGVPADVARVYGELVSRGLNPDEAALYKGMTSPGRAGRLGGSGLLSAPSGREFMERRLAVENKLCGYMLAALCQANPQAAADGLCAIFEPVYRAEAAASGR